MSNIFEAINPQIKKRRVYFSFHYQNDIWRVNQVRNSWRYQQENDREAEGFFDGSIWESSRRTGPDSLKTLIREGMKNTSVTCILVGAETYGRRWVRYEVARSIIKGNGLLVVKIHRLKNQTGYESNPGPNPLDHMGIYQIDDGRLLLAEKNNGKWVRYDDYIQAVTLPASWQRPMPNTVLPLSIYAREYCYVTNDGQQNFNVWVRHAAGMTGT
ncbi:MAG: hypothetical protein DCC73_04830 [Proteobacteria bacterium]|nr:MAG: hypothetical protein DCC73_04830 [Pseudomonadota bacterium]